MRAWIWTAVLTACMAVGCGGDDGGNAGTGGTIGGTTGGTVAGTTGGTVAGTTGGVGGTTGGAGGTGGGTMKTCADYAASGAPRGTRDAVAVILHGDGTAANMFGSCGFSSCHQGAGAPATLDLSGDIGAALVNVPSCQAAGMSRVTPGNPATSWIWIKLTGPYDAQTGAITFAATPQACAETTPGTLGFSMPWTGGGTPIPLTDSALYQICTWIEDGAL